MPVLRSAREGRLTNTGPFSNNQHSRLSTSARSIFSSCLPHRAFGVFKGARSSSKLASSGTQCLCHLHHHLQSFVFPTHPTHTVFVALTGRGVVCSVQTCGVLYVVLITIKFRVGVPTWGHGRLKAVCRWHPGVWEVYMRRSSAPR